MERGRYVGRLTVETHSKHLGLDHLFDIRHVRDPDSNSFVENVLRSELDYRITPDLKLKTFFRRHLLPKTQTDREPFMTSFLSGQEDDPALESIALENVNIDAGLDPSRTTFGAGLQYKIEGEQKWIFESSYSRTNDIPDFPRGLQNDVFLNSVLPDPDNPNIKLDRIQPFLFSQYIYGLPPYNYFSIVKERVVYKPTDDMQFIFHAAQNSNRLWGPVDENVNHQGISIDYQISDKWSLFTDYTHSVIADIPHFIATQNNDIPELNFNDHHNVYGILKYEINPNTKLNIEYGMFGKTLYEGSAAVPINPFAVTTFSLPTIDTEHLVRVSLEGEF